MAELRLFIGNKNYSSWSFRPWIAMKEKGIEFEEELVPFDFENGNPEFRRFSPSMKVPVLQHGELTVWDSLAILEYLAELSPEKGLWPEDPKERAKARSVAAEMHSGFAALRSACPMNMRREHGKLEIPEAAQKDAERIVKIWQECLEASGGPFLFGEFTVADAMYAPIASRFATYCLSDDPAVTGYIDALTDLPGWREWFEAALQESWVIPSEEV